ncbi:MAG: phosphopantetheine-binding protein [Oscillospiraceae bacterium]|jgi:acyl carrier protein|nr:phosphopantetheine-binding protein [Oscillospiraceae bacterium]MDD3261350.1 phosphopantetheine-binding protein [Oscillospiraceae bacterium]
MENKEMLEKLEKIVRDYHDDLKPGSLKPETTFEELDLDSLDLVDLVMACEDEFDIKIPDDANLKTVQDLMNLIQKAKA